MTINIQHRTLNFSPLPAGVGRGEKVGSAGRPPASVGNPADHSRRGAKTRPSITPKADTLRYPKFVSEVVFHASQGLRRFTVQDRGGGQAARVVSGKAVHPVGGVAQKVNRVPQPELW